MEETTIGTGNLSTLHRELPPSSWAGMNIGTYSLTPVGQAELGGLLPHYLIIGEPD